MIAAIAATLFIAAFSLALGAMGATWRDYGTQVLSLRQELDQCDVRRDLRFTVITTLVHSEEEEPWKPGFSSLAGLPSRAPRRPLPRHFARAA